MMDREPRRSSILKPHKQRSPFAVLESNDAVSVADTTLGKQSRRVSFASSNFVKPFVTDPDKNTIWDNTYEEVVEQTSSTQSNGSSYASSNEKENLMYCDSNMELTQNVEVVTREFTNRRTTINFNASGGEDMVIDEGVDHITSTACSTAQLCGRTVLLDEEMEFSTALSHAAIQQNFHIPSNQLPPFNECTSGKRSLIEIIKSRREKSECIVDCVNTTGCEPDTMDLTEVIPSAYVETNPLIGKTFVKSSSGQYFDCQNRGATNVHCSTKNGRIHASKGESDMELTSAGLHFKHTNHTSNVTNEECDMDLTNPVRLNVSQSSTAVEDNENIKNIAKESGVTKCTNLPNSDDMEVTNCVAESCVPIIPSSEACVETSMDLTGLSFAPQTSVMDIRNVEYDATNLPKQMPLLTQQTSNVVNNHLVHTQASSSIPIQDSQMLPAGNLPETKPGDSNTETSETKHKHPQVQISVQLVHDKEDAVEDRRISSQSVVFEEKPSRSEYSRIIEGDYNPPVNSKLIASSDSIQNFLITPDCKDRCAESFATVGEENSWMISAQQCSLVSEEERSPAVSPTHLVSPRPHISKDLSVSKRTAECDLDFDFEHVEETIHWERNAPKLLKVVDDALISFPDLNKHLENYIEGFKEINQRFDKLLKKITPELFQIDFSTAAESYMSESDTSYSGTAKGTDEAKASFSQSDTSQEEYKGIKERVEERAIRCKYFWTKKNADCGMYQFATMYGRLYFTVHFNEENGVVKKLVAEADVDENLKPIAKYVLCLFEKQLAANVIPLFLGENYDILSLLDYVQMIMQKMLDILSEYDNLASAYCLEMDEKSRFTLKIVNFDLLQVWTIIVNYSEMNITEDCVDAYAVCGSLNLRKVKQCVVGCPKGFAFFRSFIDNVKVYMKTFKKPVKK